MVKYTDINSFNALEITQNIKKEKKFSCVLPYANRDSEEYIGKIISIFTKQIGKPQMQDSLEYCMKELVMNASKANSKRLYFKEKGLNIDQDSDYETGIATFKQDIFGNFKEWEKKHEEQGYLIKVDFKIEPETFVIRVANNCLIVSEEEKRIMQRLKNAGKFNNMAEVMMFGFDETEGAGFGLIITVLMLRKIGLDEKVFSYAKGNGFTASFIKIPLNVVTEEQGTVIADEIIREIDAMPQFPETILELQKHLNDPNCDFESVSAIIKKDSALTTEIIRIANSPIYMLPSKVDDVFKAVRLIGMQGVKNLVLSLGVNKLLEKKYKKETIDEVMEHSYRVAIFAGNFVKQRKMKALYDDAYVAALLHDFGKIVVNSLKPDLIKKLEHVCFEKGIPVSKLEDLTDGYNHSLIGSQLAEKWNFPDKFTQSIRHHHVPQEAAEEFKGLAYSVYLANEMVHYSSGERKFDDINRKVLHFYQLTKEEVFKEMVERINKDIELQNKK